VDDGDGDDGGSKDATFALDRSSLLRVTFFHQSTNADAKENATRANAAKLCSSTRILSTRPTHPHLPHFLFFW
jgi:hypothetical protein